MDFKIWQLGKLGIRSDSDLEQVAKASENKLSVLYTKYCVSSLLDFLPWLR